MDVFGSLRKLTKIVFPTNSGAKNVELQAANQTGAGTIVVSIPDVGDTAGTLVEIDATQTLTNKTIDGDVNTVQDLPVTAIKTVLGDANKALVRDASGILTSALIVNANVDAAAALARSKLASGTASHVIINDGSGVLSSEATLAISRGGTNISTYTTGDFLYASASNVLSKLPIGTTGQLLRVSAGGVPEWFTGAGTGDVVGPASATNGAVAVYNGTTGKLLQNGTKLEADLATGPASATSGNLPSFNGTSGKVLQDSGKLAADVVTGPAASVDSEFAIYNSTTGKIIKRASGTGYAYGTSGVASFLSTIPAADVAGATNGSTVAAGRVGERAPTSETGFSGVTAAATTTYKQLEAQTLTAGNWLIYGHAELLAASGTTWVSGDNQKVAISSTTASTSGAVQGSSLIECANSGTVFQNASVVVSMKVWKYVNLSGSATFYLNGAATFGGTAPTWRGSLFAIRIA